MGLTTEQFRQDFDLYAKKLGLPPLARRAQLQESADVKATETIRPTEKISIHLVTDSGSKRLTDISINAKAGDYEDGKIAQHYFLSLMAVFLSVEEGRNGLKVLGITDGSVFDGVPRTFKSSGREFILSFDEQSGLLLRINAY